MTPTPTDASTGSTEGKSCASCHKTVAKLSSCAKCSTALYCSRPCQLEHWDLHKPTCSKLFELFDSTAPKGGKGLRATMKLKAGQEISRERAVLRCPNGHPARTEDEAKELHKQCVSDQFEKLSAKQQRAVLDLSSWDHHNNSKDGQATTYGLYQTNSLRLTGPDDKDGALFLTMCRINHSCAPNVNYFWRSDWQQLVVIALSDIQIGQELYGSYGPSELMDTAKRREHLLKEFGFVCQCSMCVAADTDGGAADARMNEAHRLCQQVRPFVARGEHVEAIDAIEKCLDLLVEQQMGQGVGARQLLTMGYQVALMGLKDKQLARNYLERELQLAELCEGVASPGALEIQHKLAAYS
jgi:hypothetical protein